VFGGRSKYAVALMPDYACIFFARACLNHRHSLNFSRRAFALHSFRHIRMSIIDNSNVQHNM